MGAIRRKRTTKSLWSASALLLAVLTGACTAPSGGWFNSEQVDSDQVDIEDSGGNEPAAEALDVEVEPLDEAVIATGRVATVERVVDGDSLEVALDGEQIELRLEGFNAPELYADSVTGGPDELTCNGSAAKAAVEAVLAAADGPLLVVEHDVDRFGRTLGDVVVDDMSLTSQLVAQGEGLATGDSAELRKLMQDAAANQLGVWSSRCTTDDPPAVRIGRFQVDAPGNDRFNLIEEWVEVVNESSITVGLDGWVLRDDTTGHQFPLGGRLTPGDVLTVRSGGDPDDSYVGANEMTLFLGESFPVWTNSRETIILVGPDGSFVDWRFVDSD